MGFGTGAGKGSLPRHVKGEDYRNNYDNIFRKKKEAEVYPEWVCAECGDKYGYREADESTWHINDCEVCGNTTMVTEPQGFGHLNSNWKNHRNGSNNAGSNA